MTKADKERLEDAQTAIARLERQLIGDNRFGSYGQSILAAIARWQNVVDTLTRKG